MCSSVIAPVKKKKGSSKEGEMVEANFSTDLVKPSHMLPLPTLHFFQKNLIHTEILKKIG